jgi:hypothetical protein
LKNWGLSLGGSRHEAARDLLLSAHSEAAGSTRRGIAPKLRPRPTHFRTIARVTSVDQIRAFLTKPHGAMPDLSLIRSEIDDLIDYIATLP